MSLKAETATKLEGQKLTITGWAKVLGFDPKTIAVRLRAAGHSIERHSSYDVKTVVTSVYGDEQAERNRNLKLDADRKEREEKEANRELVRIDEVEKRISERFTNPLRQELLDMPAILAKSQNPESPSKAEKVSKEWVQGLFKRMLQKLT